MNFSIKQSPKQRRIVAEQDALQAEVDTLKHPSVFAWLPGS